MKNLKHIKYILYFLVVLGCAVPMDKVNKAVEDDKNTLTLGKVQQILKKGAAQDKIVMELGSPNLVTVDSAGLETWIYDKISTVSTNAAASNSATILGGVIGGSAGIGGSIGSSGSASKQITSQKTLTVVLKFKEKKLDTYTYNASKF
jgi:outer membrane protein assembly factor BamE (lipoprotein component of BamABCDE complex)